MARGVVVVSALLITTLLTSADAHALECGEVFGGEVTTAWISRCIPLTFRVGSSLARAPERAAALQGFRAWTSAPCTDLTFQDFGDTASDPGFEIGAPESQTNVIFPITTAEERQRFMLEQNLVATTIIAFSTRTGEIFDADVLINELNFRVEVV